jgi:hypothetical protein
VGGRAAAHVVDIVSAGKSAAQLNKLDALTLKPGSKKADVLAFIAAGFRI